MGLFDFGKKKKEQAAREAAREQFKQKYRAMNLKELTSLMENLWQVSSEIETDEIRAAYILALLKAEKSEGGFGISASRLNDEFEIHSSGSIGFWVKLFGAAYRYDEFGSIDSINRPLVFLGNYMRADPKADLATARLITSYVFPLADGSSADALSERDIVNEHHQIYNPWLGEPSADPNDSQMEFIRRKVNSAVILCTPSECEQYGIFKRKNGAVTSEYATVDDLTGAKTISQLNKLLDSLQTRF